MVLLQEIVELSRQTCGSWCAPCWQTNCALSKPSTWISQESPLCLGEFSLHLLHHTLECSRHQEPLIDSLVSWNWHHETELIAGANKLSAARNATLDVTKRLLAQVPLTVLGPTCQST